MDFDMHNTQQLTHKQTNKHTHTHNTHISIKMI